MVQEYYDILDLNPGATTDEIRKAYRLKAKSCHPDASKSPETAFEFIRLKEAFDVVLKNKHLENTIRHQGFAHPRDPYFRRTHGYHPPYARSNGSKGSEEQNNPNDFLRSRLGYILYLLMHILFLVTGFIVLLGPIYTIIKHGFADYGSFAYWVFNLIAAMAFGVIMIVKISGSIFRFIKKP